MNKINVKQLLRVSKNTQRVPLTKTEGTIISTLPADNVKVEGRDITIFGSKKDVDLTFVKNDEGFVSSSKPVPTTVKPSDLSADLNFKEKTATIKFSGLSAKGEATLKDQSVGLDLGIINDQEDKLSIKSKDDGLEFDIAIVKQRDEYSYAFDFTMDGSIKPELKENEFVLSDTDGNELFSINGIHMVTEGGRISTNLEILLGDDGKCVINPDADFIKENILNGNISVAFNVSGHVVPMISLESFRDGKSAQPSNDMYIFGYKGRQEYMLKATIKAKEIASELNFNEGFRIYDGEANNLIKSQNFDESLESITIDITNKVKSAIEAVNAGKEVKDIVLEFKYSCTPMAASDDEYAGEELADNYVEIYGIYFSDTSNRPYIGSKFVSIGEVKAGTPFIEKELGRSGKSKINIFEGSLQHGFSLGSIAAKTFRIPFSMFYDSRLLTQKFERPKTIGLPKGWMFNLSQCLIKDRKNANKTKGIKEVLYIDGENNTHVLTEKWFYKDENDKEIVVTKDEVYLGNDQKLKYEDANGTAHDVTYQVDNDDGLTYVSTNSKLNYAKQSDMKMKMDFALVSNNKKTIIPLTASEKGTWMATFYSENTTGTAIDKKNANSLFPEDSKNRTVNSLKEQKLYSIKDIYFLDDKAENPRINLNGKQTTLHEVPIEVVPLYKDGKCFIQNATSKFTMNYSYTIDGNTFNETKSSVEFDDTTIELQVDKQLDISSDTDIADYYENEDISNVNSQIKQCEDYIKELQSQCESYSNSISSLNEQLNTQKELKDLMDQANVQRDLASEANDGCVALYTNDGNGNQSYNAEKTKKYVEATNKQTELNDDYQEKSYEFQVSSINKQIEEQNAALQKLYVKINDYQVQLNNLYELKESYIEAQKEGVQDYIYDKEGNLLGFDYYGKLVYLSDRYENEISLSYVDDKLVEISSEKQRIVLHYNKENELDYVVDAAGRKTKFKCTSNTFIMTKRDEKGEAESTTFTFDSEKRLTNIKDKNGQSFGFTWSNFMVSSVTNKSSIGSISETGVEPKSEEVLSTTLIENTGDYIEVENREAKTIDIYHLDYEGRLIGQTYRDEDDDSKDTVSINCYDEDNQLLELSYEVKNRIGEIALQGNNVSKIEKTIEFGEDGIDISRFTNREMFAVGLDFSGVDPNQTKNNTAEFTVDVDGIKNSFNFKKIPHGILAVPALIQNKAGTVKVTITFSKNIKLDALGKIGIYRADDATINKYDEDDHVISSITKDGETTFSDFDGDNPTSCVTTDRYGVTKTSRAQFDASGRPIYEEDGDGNCKETYYDEKGNAIETREYNKANSSLAKVSRTKYDEEGNATEFEGVMRDKNGNYPQEKATYLPGTDVVSSVKYPNGQVMVYGYDFNTGLMTEMASDANGQDNATQYGYVANYLVSLAHHGVKFSYVLDNKGRKISTKLNGAELVVSKYDDNYSDGTVTNGQKVITTFADGFESTTITDKDGDLISTVTNDSDSIVYEYDDRDRLVKVDRNSGEETVTTAYNVEDQIVSNEYKVDGMTTREDITYDDHGRVAAKTETDGSIVTTTVFEYVEGKEDLVKEVSIGDTKHRFEYDALGRVTRKELLDSERPLVDESIEYLRYGENSLDLVKEHDVRIGDAISDTTEYEYDVSGNITSIKRDEYETRYQYDELGRLVREDNPVLDKTIVYKYDASGNILLKKEYKYSLEDRLYSPNITSYTYASKGNKDQLINFNGETIAYDVMGRPTSIGTHSLTWNKKGKLVGYDDVAYTYGLNGIRTSKTINGVKTTYFILNNKILAEQSDDKKTIYHYSSDKLIGFAFNGVEYIYERNIQGDVLRIYRKDNLTLVAEYQYDAYGNHKVINHTGDNIGDINPFRYRGYYFDVETGWYYLNTRYYSPAMGRFISPDELSILDETRSQINGLNLYMYCGNNPVMNVDQSGRFIVSITALIIGAIAGAVISAGVNVVSQGIQKGWNNINIGEVLFSAAIGAIGGAIGASSIGVVGQIGANALLSMVESAGTDLINGRDVNAANAITSAFIGGAFALVGGAGIQNSGKIAPKLFSQLPFKSDIAQTAINKYLLGYMSKKGVQGVINLTFKSASFSLTTLLKNTAKQMVIDNIPSSLVSSSISEFASWLFCRF